MLRLLERAVTLIQRMQMKHWVILAAYLTSLGTQIKGVEHGWVDVWTPAFVGSSLIQLGVLITAIFVGKPEKPFDPQEARLPPGTPDRRNSSPP